MVLHVAKSPFSNDVAHISFPAEADRVRNEVLAVEDFGGWAPAQITGGEGAAQAHMVVVKDNEITKIPLSETAGKLKYVDPNGSIIKEAKLVGISFGDK